MPRKLWGEFETKEEEEQKPISDIDKMIPVSVKRAKLDEVKSRPPIPQQKNVTLNIHSPLITQTIEVMKQTEMLQSLIDTYSQKSGSSNYLLNPCQMIPEVDFPPENAANFVDDDKFTKPIWFIPPLKTDFSQGVPKRYPRVNADVCRAAFRKAICGQLRVAGFTDAADSALVLYVDAVDEFLRGFMRSLRDIHDNNPQLEYKTNVEIVNLEKAYNSLTNSSLTQMHNFRKHQLVVRNRAEISEFKGVLQEYAKLMRESQSMQKEEHFQETDFLNILEMPATSDQMTSTTSAAAVTGLSDIASGSGGALLNMFDSSTAHLSLQQTSGKDVFHAVTRTAHDLDAGGGGGGGDKNQIQPTTESLLG